MPEEDVPQEIVEMGVAISLGIAGLQASENVSEEVVNQIRAVWPEELSADAMEIGSQVALAFMAWVNGSVPLYAPITGDDILAFSQTIMNNG